MISRLYRTVNNLEHYIREQEVKHPATTTKSCDNLAQLVGVKKCVKVVGKIADDISSDYLDCLVSTKSGKEVTNCVKEANTKVQSLKHHIDNHPECQVKICDYEAVFDNWKMGCIVQAHTTVEANKCIQSLSQSKGDQAPIPKTKVTAPAKAPKKTNVHLKTKVHAKVTAQSKLKLKAKAKAKAKSKKASQAKQAKTQKELKQLKHMVKHLQHMKQHPSDTVIIPQAGPTTYNVSN